MLKNFPRQPYSHRPNSSLQVIVCRDNADRVAIQRNPGGRPLRLIWSWDDGSSPRP